MGNLEDFLEKNKLTVGVFLIGLILIGTGVLGFKIFSLEEPKVEILGESAFSSAAESPELTVEISGEVIKPGVYEFPLESRVNDLLTAAGGLSAKADREWVAKNVNLAQKLTDGVKIYIPGLAKVSPAEKEEKKININSASAAELDSLWGVGPATARQIINGRPYQRPEELLERKIVKSNVWEKIKDEVMVW